jgi:hypothetical protein
VKTQNPSACTTLNWKVCKPAIALYCLYLSVIKTECVTEVLINPNIRTRYFRHAYHQTRDNIIRYDIYILKFNKIFFIIVFNKMDP